jgi:hypothetical protein
VAINFKCDEADVFTGTFEQTTHFMSERSTAHFLTIDLDHVGASGAALASTMQTIIPLVKHIREVKLAAKLDALIAAIVPDVELPARTLRDAAMLMRARAGVLADSDWLTAAQVAQAAGFSDSNPSAQPHKWKRTGQIFTIVHKSIEYYPAYGLDPATEYRPLPVMRDVIKIFAPVKDGWGMAYWFTAVNSYLGGKRPVDSLHDQESLLHAASMEVAGMQHG